MSDRRFSSLTAILKCGTLASWLATLLAIVIAWVAIKLHDAQVDVILGIPVLVSLCLGVIGLIATIAILIVGGKKDLAWFVIGIGGLIAYAAFFAIMINVNYY